MNRIPVFLSIAVLASCTSLPDEATTWRGHEEGRVKVQIRSLSPLPVKGWLAVSSREQATGVVGFTKWGSGGFRYKRRAYFQFRPKWEADVEYLGIVETDKGSSEFCTVNPEHGGFQEGDTFVITHAYDYCARLVRK